jgi:acyl-CoA synthetase (NDP forming)
LNAHDVRVPAFEFPENAARAIALAARYGRWRARPADGAPKFADARADEAAAIISRELAKGAGWLSASAVAPLLDCYGLPRIATRFAAATDDPTVSADRLGYPVVLKADARGLIHKTDAGAVRLGLTDGRAVRRAAAQIEAAVASHGSSLEGWVVQPMASPGVEMIVGVVNDPSFGPVLACGAGGTTAELIKDVAVRITPIGALDAREMVRSLKTFPLLDGYRGTPRCDCSAIEEVLLRVSAMVEAHPEIVELDCNPLIATPAGALIVDARVRVEPAPAPAPISSVRS